MARSRELRSQCGIRGSLHSNKRSHHRGIHPKRWRIFSSLLAQRKMVETSRSRLVTSRPAFSEFCCNGWLYPAALGRTYLPIACGKGCYRQLSLNARQRTLRLSREPDFRLRVTHGAVNKEGATSTTS